MNECYPLNETELEISIYTGYDVEKVFLCYGDPFSSGIMGGAEKWSGEKQEMIHFVPGIVPGLGMALNTLCAFGGAKTVFGCGKAGV